MTIDFGHLFAQLPADVEDSDLKPLRYLTTLRKLGLRRSKKITDLALVQIAHLSNLRELCLSASWNITDAGYVESISLMHFLV